MPLRCAHQSKQNRKKMSTLCQGDITERTCTGDVIRDFSDVLCYDFSSQTSQISMYSYVSFKSLHALYTYGHL
jgi:hypothetical protein